MKNIGILGSTGKMGAALLAIKNSPDFELTPLCKVDSLPANLSGLIDFSHADALNRNLNLAITHALPIVIGTTGHTQASFDLMQEVSCKIPLLYSSNFSIGITLIKKFLSDYSHYLADSYVDIIETHHLEKKDLPSGTALDIASIFQNKAISLSCLAKRTSQDLIIHSHRIPAHAGAHTVRCAFQGEMLSLQHEVVNRSVYAQGALLAMQFLLQKDRGFYIFSDVFTTENCSLCVP